MTWTLMLLFLVGVLCNTCQVDYQQGQVCAVKGSSVVIPCSFHCPDHLMEDSLMWGHIKPQQNKGRFIPHDDLRKVTARNVGDKQHNCSLEIRRVEHSDEGKYTFRFKAKHNKHKTGRWQGNVCPTLKVVDLKVVVSQPHDNGTTKDGDSVNLTCVNGCDEGHLSSAFTWFKNRKPINEGVVLWLSNVTSADSGNYSCSLTAHTGTTSDVINIDVEYGPKNTSVSVRPSLEVDAGSSFTLLCSSHANPPVEAYTWFRIGENENITAVGQQPEFSTADGGRYLCSAANKHGSQNSSVVTLTLKVKASIQSCGEVVTPPFATNQTSAYWATFGRDALIITVSASVAVLLIVTVVAAVWRKRKRTPKTDSDEDTQDTDYVNWLICDNNQSQEGHPCEGGAAELVYTTVVFSKTRTSNMLEQVVSSDDGEVIYSTVCRKQPLNPSYIEPL